jgi:hypothetical protein
MDFKHQEEELNKRISRMVRSLPNDHYATEEEISFYRRYTHCDDFILSNSLIKDIWKWFRTEIINYSVEGDKQVPSPVSVLHTNSGAGKILDRAPSNSVITAYNLDYICKRVTDFVCQEREQKGMYYSYERDISQYFAVCNTNSSRKYNIVITQPNEDMSFYKGIDNNKEIGNLSPLEYYVKRGSHFVNENGYLVVIFTPNSDFSKRNLEQISGMKVVKEFKDKDLEYLSYEALILKK